ncbi:class-III pyridoxal-phosphate-dependent aminotransferase [Ottowia thiooxydans]|uniref:4-aminobutyrate aminotransferase-like enzyme n=1 Tax=Ottowia thiooxydans TaxID=219182 RepID=A0ABV2QC95_9BURK
MSSLLVTTLTTNDSDPIFVTGGEGCWYTLSNGRKVLDGSNTAAALGHRHPAIVEAMERAASHPTVSEGWAWKGREQAAQDLLEISYGSERSWVGAVRFGLSGSETNDMALSLCQVLTGRTPIATRERAYHGLTGLSRAVTTQPQWHGGLSRADGRVMPAPSIDEVRVLSAPTASRYGERVADLAQMDEGAMATSLEGAAAVIIDYTQGGIYHHAAYQDRVARAAKRAGALWIADEVVTGAGRSGRWFAFQGGESRPDMVTMGKGLAGGIGPIGAVVLSKELCSELKGAAWQNYSTFRGHPTAMEGVSAYLRTIVRDQLLERVAALEPRIAARLIQLGERHPSVARVDGRGLHWTVEFHGSHWKNWKAATAQVPIASFAVKAALEAGVVLGTSGEETSLFIAPALIISDSELELLFQGLDHALEAADLVYAQQAQ